MCSENYTCSADQLRSSENKGADQLRSYSEADQHLCFRYMDSTIYKSLKILQNRCTSAPSKSAPSKIRKPIGAFVFFLTECI